MRRLAGNLLAHPLLNFLNADIRIVILFPYFFFFILLPLLRMGVVSVLVIVVVLMVVMMSVVIALGTRSSHGRQRATRQLRRRQRRADSLGGACPALRPLDLWFDRTWRPTEIEHLG